MPQAAIWDNAYVVTSYSADWDANTSQFTKFIGHNVFALNRTKMLAGQALGATDVREYLVAPTIAVIPANVDGTTQPPTGSPAFLLGLNPTANNELQAYKLTINFNTPQAATDLAKLPSIFVNPYTEADDVPQPDGNQLPLMAVSFRLMTRLAYRNVRMQPYVPS